MLFQFENWVWSRPSASFSGFETAFETKTKTIFCSCSAGQKPCCHALGLAILVETLEADVFEKAADLPTFLNHFGQKGKQKSLFKASKSETEPTVLVEKADEKKEILERFSTGIADLESWLFDVARQGFADFAKEEKAFENVAARMADAKMSELARRLRLLNEASSADVDWAEKMGEAMGDFFVALKMFEKKESLEEAEKADLAAWLAPVSKDLVQKTGQTESDVWTVFGQTEKDTPDNLTERQVWLRGERTGRWAMLLDYSFGHQPFSENWRTGEKAVGELTFFPSTVPLRALPKKLSSLDEMGEKWPESTLFDVFLDEYAQVLGKNAFLKTWPIWFSEAIPFLEKERFGLVDTAENVVWLKCSATVGWSILAISGGSKIGVFGIWDGSQLAPLSVFDGEKLISL